MRTSGLMRLLVLATAAVTALAQDAVLQERHLAVANNANGVAEAISSLHVARELHKKKAAAAETPAPPPAEDETEDEAEEAETPAPTPKKKHHKKDAETQAPAPAPAPTEAPTTAPPPPPPAPTTQAPAPAPAPAETEAPKKKKHHKKDAETPAPQSETEEEAAETPAPTKVNDKRIKGYNNTGVIDGSSEGSAEIDKIDLRNADNWVSVYNDPPLLVIKASLYAFISYNDSRVCDSFNMTLNAVEQKADGNGTFSYHVVTYINCTKDGVDETPGRFILNFIPEGKRLLLTECGHRETGEIVNWLKIKEEVPECMTPHERKSFLAQPMKHIHASNGSTDSAPKKTDFFTRLEELDGREVAIAGSATVALIAVIVVIVVFVMRKRKAQKDLERTIAGAKADHADDDDKDEEKDEDKEEEKKEKKKEKKTGDEEGSFVNSPAVKV